MMKVDENDDEQVNKWEWNGWVGWIGTKESSVIERNDLFILFTDKKNINIFLCKQSYLHEQHTYIFRKYISLSLSPSSIITRFSFLSLSLFWYTPNSHALAILFWISITWNWNFPQYIHRTMWEFLPRGVLSCCLGRVFNSNVTQKNRNIISNKMKSTTSGEGEFYRNYFLKIEFSLSTNTLLRCS